ncbi:hypothetical protein CYMTET_44436 [Cymbomonas tetramitiformis]|uniref:Uncharacterized protein n=1 Tax=Cymbomonas tetramitiformis TaxID=36881 RepID=A0AAE0C063_9CHLO|nr:hypothetical protein CYMTET_44436 [Cymbomonas tetramitiformis]
MLPALARRPNTNKTRNEYKLRQRKWSKTISMEANPEAPLFDEASDTILDPRRILSEDELPQFIDYAEAKGNNKKKVGAGKGVQTGNTLAERMDMLDKEVSARGLPRPISILTDGHKSRFSNEVLSKCREYQFRMYVERSNSSQFLQKFHNQYIKAKKNFKKEKAIQLTRETGKPHNTGDIKLSKIDFLLIFSRISLDWSTAEYRRTAFRVVGLLQNALAPSEIDRKAFIVQPNSPKA